MKTRKDVVESRREVFKASKRRHTFNKGDKRVYTPRICVMCSRPLSSLVIRENRYVVSFTHIRCHINDIVVVDVCENINSCYRNLEQRGELQDGNV